jgi:electron transfer flavoprotein beta subunit
MKIVVLTKIVPVRVEFDKASKKIIRSKEAMINQNDLIALDFALKLKRKYGAEVIAFAMSPSIYEQIFSEVFDLGADKAILISDRNFANADVFATTEVLGNAIKKLVPDFDYVFGGNFSSDGFTGQFVGELASFLSVPFFSNVTDVELTDSILNVVRESDDSIEKFSVKGKVALSFSHLLSNVALPNLYEIFSEKSKKVEIHSNEDLCLDNSCIGENGSKTIVEDVFELGIPVTEGLIVHNGDKVIIEALKVEVSK